MQYTLYNLIGSGNYNADVSFEIIEEPQVMWPYREEEIRKVFNSCPERKWRVIAYDNYKNGKFMHTAYYLS